MTKVPKAVEEKMQESVEPLFFDLDDHLKKFDKKIYYYEVINGNNPRLI